MLPLIHSLQKTSFHIRLYSKILHTTIHPHQVMPTTIIIMLLLNLLQLPSHLPHPTNKLFTIIPLLKLFKLFHYLSLITFEWYQHLSNFMCSVL